MEEYAQQHDDCYGKRKSHADADKVGERGAAEDVAVGPAQEETGGKGAEIDQHGLKYKAEIADGVGQSVVHHTCHKSR